MLEVMVFVFPGNCYVCFSGSVWTSACWWEELKEFFFLLYLHTELCFTYQRVFNSTHRFLVFTLPVLNPMSLRGRQQDTGWRLSSWLGSTTTEKKVWLKREDKQFNVWPPVSLILILLYSSSTLLTVAWHREGSFGRDRRLLFSEENKPLPFSLASQN